jgi:hypothetical protein
MCRACVHVQQAGQASIVNDANYWLLPCCLQDNLAQGLIPDGPCKNMVYEYQQLAAQDIRFDVPLADACHDDRSKLCGNVPPVRSATAVTLNLRAAAFAVK